MVVSAMQHAHGMMVILLVLVQAGVQHVILAVSYRAELLEKEMKEQEKRVSNIIHNYNKILEALLLCF